MMRRFPLLIITAGVFLLASTAFLINAVAQEKEENRDFSHVNIIRVNPAAIQTKQIEEDFADKWFRYRNYLANGLPDEAAAEFSELVALQKQAQVQRGVEIAQAMIYEGYLYMQRGDLAKAKVLFSSAIVLDRSQSEAYAALAWATIRSDKLAVVTFIRYNFLAIRYYIATFWDAFALLANLSLMLVISLCLAFGLCTLALLHKYSPLLYHDVQEFHSNARDKESSTRLLYVVVLGLPFLLFFGAWWAVCYLSAILCLYYSLKERVLLLAMLLLAILIPLMMPIYRICYAAYRDPAIQILVSCRDSGNTKSLIDSLVFYSSAHPDDVDVEFALGNQYLHSGRYEEALAIYRKVIDKAPSYQMAYVNIGNIFFHLHDYENAIKNYMSAIDIDSQSALINFNIKAAYSERFDFSKAETYMRQAREIDSGAVEHYLSNDEIKVIDDDISAAKIWHRMISGKISKGLEQDPGYWHELMVRREFRDSIKSLYYPLLAVFLAGGCFYFFAKRKDCALSCVKCGRPYCRRCQRGVGGDRYCSQCAHIFLVKDGISEDARIRKFNQIQQFNASTARWLFWGSLILPGAEQVMGERPVRGFFTMTSWLLLLSPFYCQGLFFERSGPFGMYCSRFASALLIALILIYYFSHNLRNIFHPSRFNDPSEW